MVIHTRTAIATPAHLCYNANACNQARPVAATNSRRTLTDSTSWSRTMAVPHSSIFPLYTTTHNRALAVHS